MTASPASASPRGPALWCEHAWLGGSEPVAGVLVELDGERIAAVTEGAEPGDAERLHGLTIPGLANAHSHAFQRALRGRAQEPGSFWTWREQMLALAETIDPDAYLRLARATYAEMALAGVTIVGEFHYLHHGPGGVPYDDPNEMAWSLVAAAAEAGIRIVLLDACYLHGGSARFRDASAETWAERASALDASRRGDPQRACGRPRGCSRGRGVGGAAGRAAACPRVRAAGRERVDAAGPRRHPNGHAARRGRAERALHGDPRDACVRRGHRTAWLGGRDDLPLPDDRARPRRRHRARAHARRRGRAAGARQRLACGHRPARGGTGARARRAPGVRRARTPQRRGAPARGDRRRVREPRPPRRRADRAGRARRPDDDRPGLRAPRRRAGRGRRLLRDGSRRARRHGRGPLDRPRRRAPDDRRRARAARGAS